MLTYKRKLILTKNQEQRISSWIGACRMVYNMGLEIKKEAWKNRQISISEFNLSKELKTIKDVEWMKDVPAQSLQNSMERLERSYRNFFRTCRIGGGFPKFATKKKYKSIIIKNNIRLQEIIVITNKIKLPKLGYIKMFKDAPVIGIPKQAIIKKEPTGYFVYIVCDGVSKSMSCQDESQVIGLDMGIAHFCIDSNGNFVENPRHFKKYEDRLRIDNRSLSRKKKYSNRWKKQAKKLAKLHHKIANVRKDFIHKLSTNYAKVNHTVYVEDLKITNMVKNKNLSKHILDCGWGMFRDMLEYKTNLILVNPKYTSQTCNACGTKDATSRISQSKFACKHCGNITNADVNAAKNILSRGTALNRKREAIACALVE